MFLQELHRLGTYRYIQLLSNVGCLRRMNRQTMHAYVKEGANKQVQGGLRR